MTFVVRGFKPHQYDMVRVWGNNQKYNRGRYDFEAFPILDKGTFWIGELDGEPIASIAISLHTQKFAFVGLYYVKPQYRGKNYGMQLWRKAFENFQVQNIGLVSSPGQSQKKYGIHGFKSFHKTYLYNIPGTGKQYQSDFLKDCRTLDFDQLSKYDSEHFVCQRKAFLEKWINQPESQATAFVRNGNIQGYGVVRISDEGHRIGPLFADSYEVAYEILKSLVGFVKQGKNIRMDVPLENENGEKLVLNFTKNEPWKHVQMYTKEQPFKKIKQIYGLTSIETG